MILDEYKARMALENILEIYSLKDSVKYLQRMRRRKMLIDWTLRELAKGPCLEG